MESLLDGPNAFNSVGSPRPLTAPRGEMTPAIKLGDVVNFFEYEKVREGRRRRVIALKARRREEVGLYLSFVFEKRALLPGPRELSATLFIEIAEKEQIKPVPASWGSTRALRVLAGGRARLPGLAGRPGGRPPRGPCARPPLPGGPGRMADRPGLLTGARDGAARVYCMIMNQM